MGKALRTALPRTSPVCISFFLLALSYGVLMGTRGFSFLWPMCMSAFIFTGSMEFVTVNLLVSAFNPFVTFMLAVMLGTRHLFYGISMLGRFKNMGAKKPYLIFSLCDETFAIDNGTIIAQAMGVPESVIALTFVALGTSLPELVTAITSLIKGHSDLSVGNVVGANVFNLVLVSGVSVTLAPFTIPQSSTLFGVNSSLVLDLPVMLAVMLIMTVPALVKGKMNRAQGIILLAIYAAFCAIQFTM